VDKGVFFYAYFFSFFTFSLKKSETISFASPKSTPAVAGSPTAYALAFAVAQGEDFECIAALTPSPLERAGLRREYLTGVATKLLIAPS
jgi:hypothetical protein